MTFLKKILLVDTEPRAAAAVRIALEKTGKYLIREEHDSRCVVNAARWFQPNLILVDVIAPGSETSVTAQRLQEDAAFKDTPLLFFSSKAAGENCVVSAGVLSGYTFLANPVAIDEFVSCLAELLTPSP